MKIAIEVVWNNFITKPEQFVEYIDAFKSPWVGAYFDCSNMVKYGVPPADWIRKLGKRMLKFDFKGYSKAKRVAIGEGTRTGRRSSRRWPRSATTAGRRPRSARRRGVLARRGGPDGQGARPEVTPMAGTILPGGADPDTYRGLPALYEFVNADGDLTRFNCGQAAACTLLTQAHAVPPAADPEAACGLMAAVEQAHPPDNLFGWFGTSRRRVDAPSAWRTASSWRRSTARTNCGSPWPPAGRRR